jgi:hypothetical protein
MRRNMREIEFRGRNKPTGEWKYGYLVVDEKYCQIWQEGDVPVPVDPETVGEYTGRQTKNGTKVYEGDIFLDSDIDAKWVVVWYKYAFALRLTDTRYQTKSVHHSFLMDFDFSNCTLIGNVYEHPHLVKEEHVTK